VFQTIYSVWVIENYNSNRKNEDLKASVRKKRNILSREKEKEVSLFVDEPLGKK